jgi:hypothetical protein
LRDGHFEQLSNSPLRHLDADDLNTAPQAQRILAIVTVLPLGHRFV